MSIRSTSASDVRTPAVSAVAMTPLKRVTFAYRWQR